MQHIIKHDLSPELAKKAADKAAEHYVAKWEKYDAKMTWLSDTHAEVTFRVKGVSVAATIDMHGARRGATGDGEVDRPG
jgi:Trm5-related predicted tRNA methylase